ncbi:MAG: hypothetical protein AAB728_02405 [Patescibacteria group bacterium]
MSIGEAIPTIKEAEDLVRRYGDSMTGQFWNFDCVFRGVRIKDRENCHLFCEPPGKAVDLPHRNILSAIGFIRTALLRTHRQFEMVTGSDRILRTLEAAFRRMLKELTANGGRARVIVVGQTGEFQRLAEEFAETLQVVQGASNGPVTHFFTSDDDVCRVEEPHAPLSDTMDAACIPAVYYPSHEPKTHSERRVFDRYWSRLTGEKRRGASPSPPVAV